MIRVLFVIVVAVCALLAEGCRVEQLTTEPPPPTPPDLRGTCLAVQGTFDPRAPGFIVTFKTGVDPITTTKDLESKYRFKATYVYTALAGFAAQLSSAAVVGVSCEQSVASMSYVSVARLATP